MAGEHSKRPSPLVPGYIIFVVAARIMDSGDPSFKIVGIPVEDDNYEIDDDVMDSLHDRLLLDGYGCGVPFSEYQCPPWLLDHAMEFLGIKDLEALKQDVED